MEYSAKQKEEILNEYINTKVNIRKIADTYNVSERTIYRWLKNYDGTLESLKNKPCNAKSSHPNTLSNNEIKRLEILFDTFPYATNKKIAELLGTNRNSATIAKYRNKYINNTNRIPKNKIEGMFNQKSLDFTNKKDVYSYADNESWLIEINNASIFIAKENGNNPCGFTPFFSLALKFNTKTEAQNFINNINNTTNWKLSPYKISKE